MSTVTPSNTIDFDAAKLQRLGFFEKQAVRRTPISLLELRRQMNLQLQTSLEAERILALFFTQVQRLVSLDALAYQHPGYEIRFELGQTASHSAGYRLSHEGEYLGELTFRRNKRFSDDELAQLESLLASLLFPLRNALLYRAAVQNALRDSLTGTGNRLALQQTLEREVELAKRNLQPLSVLMLDIDFFKKINDQHGHQVGDEVLRAVATTLKAALRNVDMIYRYGGEEFMVLLSNTSREAAAVIGERLRNAVLALQYLVQGRALDVSVSVGCATLLTGEAGESMVRRADNALYVAKKQGRNRVALAG